MALTNSNFIALKEKEYALSHEYLRLVSGMQNSRNRKMHINNTSGHTGVYWHKKHQKWVAAIGNGKRKNGRALYDYMTI